MLSLFHGLHSWQLKGLQWIQYTNKSVKPPPTSKALEILLWKSSHWEPNINFDQPFCASQWWVPGTLKANCCEIGFFCCCWIHTKLCYCHWCSGPSRVSYWLDQASKPQFWPLLTAMRCAAPRSRDADTLTHLDKKPTYTHTGIEEVWHRWNCWTNIINIEFVQSFRGTIHQ